jgi:uncharacterized protein (TIGR03437 family)
MLWQNTLGFAAITMAVDPNGGVYVIPAILPGDQSIFVAKLSSGGTGVAWKTPVGFNLPGWLPVLTVDSQGRAYVAGYYDLTNNVTHVVRLNAAGSAVDYTAQLTGIPVGIAVDGSGAAFVAGIGAQSNFFARLAPNGSAGFYSTLPQAIWPTGVAVDPGGAAVMYGTEIIGGNESGVLQHFDSTGAATISTAIPWGVTFQMDAAGNTYIVGYAFDGYASELHPVRNSLATCGSAWLSVVAPDGSVLQTTYIPGAANGSLVLIATGPNSTVSVLSSAADTTFAPTQAGPFSSDGTILLRLSPNANAQTFPLACLGNAATYKTGPIAPGDTVALFGSGLGPQQGIETQATLQRPFPTQAANVVVTFDGTPAPLLWVQDAQINVVAPWSLTPGRTTQVCVSNTSVKTNCLTWPVAQTDPGVFTVDGYFAAALNQDGTVNSANNPAAPGSIVAVFATGLGPITPPQADGTLVGLPLPNNVLPIAVETVSLPFGSPFSSGTVITRFAVTYAGPAPYLVAGVSQINFKIVPYVSDQVQIYVVLSSAQSQGFAVYVASH